MAKKEPLYPHEPKSRKQPLYPHEPKSQLKKGENPLETKPTRDDVSVNSWVERDRLGIWITDNRTDKTIVEWWDDDARQMFDDGFFKEATFTRSGELGGPPFINSVLDYAEEMGFLVKESSEVKANYYYCDNTRLHSNNEVIQIKTEEENPKCPYCSAVMTYGRYWGPLPATQL